MNKDKNNVSFRMKFVPPENMEWQFKFKPWEVTENEIIIGKGLFKTRVDLRSIRNGNLVYFNFVLRGVTGRIELFQPEKVYYKQDKPIKLGYTLAQKDQAYEALVFIIENSGMSDEQRKQAYSTLKRLEEEQSSLAYLSNNTTNYDPYAAAAETQKNKDASVIGRAVVGGIVAGPAGAVVGALSAVDKNNKKNN